MTQTRQRQDKTVTTRSSTKSKLPAALITALEEAWRQHEEITCCATWRMDEGREHLDTTEAQAYQSARRWAQDNGRLVLGISAPIWSRLPREDARLAPGKTNAPPHADEKPWARGELLAIDDVLVCRVKAHTIPILPNLTEDL
jgi:hypothetical protein